MAVCFIMLNIICMMFNNGVVFNMPAAVLMVTMLSLIGIVTPASSVIGAFIHSHPGVTPTAVSYTHLFALYRDAFLFRYIFLR